MITLPHLRITQISPEQRVNKPTKIPRHIQKRRVTIYVITMAGVAMEVVWIGYSAYYNSTGGRRPGQDWFSCYLQILHARERAAWINCDAALVG